MLFFFKLRIITVSALQAIVILITLIPQLISDYNIIILIESAIMLTVLVLITHEYLSASIITLRLMSNLHKFEFRRHACRMISLSVTTMISLFYACIGFYSITLVTACLEINTYFNIVSEDGQSIEQVGR